MRVSALLRFEKRSNSLPPRHAIPSWRQNSAYRCLTPLSRPARDRLRCSSGLPMKHILSALIRRSSAGGPQLPFFWPFRRFWQFSLVVNMHPAPCPYYIQFHPTPRLPACMVLARWDGDARSFRAVRWKVENIRQRVTPAKLPITARSPGGTRPFFKVCCKQNDYYITTQARPMRHPRATQTQSQSAEGRKPKKCNNPASSRVKKTELCTAG
jgi:hypothetical protein